jgi:6,7-dimethyl-8-ribityllumazine synthase
VLGFIEKGETLHGENMGHVVHRTLMELQLERRKPKGLGIIGPGATPEQAEARKERYAKDAVFAAFAHQAVLEELVPEKGGHFGF